MKSILFTFSITALYIQPKQRHDFCLSVMSVKLQLTWLTHFTLGTLNKFMLKGSTNHSPQRHT